MSDKLLLNVQSGIIYRNTLPIDIRDDQSKNYHILAPSSHLILSSTVGSYVTISGNLNIPSFGAFTGSVKINTGTGILTDLVASGTFSGSFSGSLDVNEGVVNNSLGHLILSSSAGSNITISGNLGVGGKNPST